MYENNSAEERFPYDENLNKIYDVDYEFDPKKKVTTNTIVKFRVSRDKDGIVTIEVESQGHPAKKYSISTVIPPITEDSKQHIARSIELMDSVIEECK